VDELSFEIPMPKYDLIISPPLMNASGMLGFAPQADGRVDITKFGAFITNPLSRNARSPARTRTQVHYAGGFLLHSGYPNPGLKAAINRYAARWARAPVPIIVHLLAEDVDSLQRMVARLEELEGVMGIEIGLPPNIDPQYAGELIHAAAGELPLVLCMPVDTANFYFPFLTGTAISAISLGPPRGALPDAGGQIVAGRLYGPAIFPSALAWVQEAAQIGVPVIAAGGVYSPLQVEMLLAAGAAAVQLDAVLWSLGWGDDERESG
jgi:dihydroorotate dehydrogenase (NAD+) catalytic subunit